jgi:hypothetical protein
MPDGLFVLSFSSGTNVAHTIVIFRVLTFEQVSGITDLTSVAKHGFEGTRYWVQIALSEKDIGIWGAMALFGSLCREQPEDSKLHWLVCLLIGLGRSEWMVSHN